MTETGNLPLASQTSTFLLVHGAWHGGWCWKKTADLLRRAGCNVFTPSLTGLGERAHLLAPDVDLTTHIKDILGVLEFEDLTNVVLVGHSYGGMVISGAAVLAPSRLAHLIYLDAFLPEDGKAVRDYGPGEMLDQIAQTKGDGWGLPVYSSATDFGITDEADAAWVNSRLGDQPYKTFTQALDLAPKVDASIRCAYILTTQKLFVSHVVRAKDLGFDCYEPLEAGHDSMITRPAELTELLLSIARKPHIAPAMSA